MEYSTPITFCGDLDTGNEIFIKRDDLIPFSFGGNKVRIAKEFFEDMELQNKNCIVGYGNARSNLCRVLANMSYARMGQAGYCHIISPSDADGTRKETYNSLMVKGCGAIIHTCTKQNVAETVEKVMRICCSEGKKPYYIYGDKTGHGNEAVPVRAYVKAYNELKGYFDYIFLATGTGMTQAGLIAGKAISEGTETIVGISISRRKEQEIPVIENYVNAFFRSIGKEKAVGEVLLEDNYIGKGYGFYNDEILDTIQSVMTHFGIPLDTTYTGKAFYGMINFLKKNKIIEKKILFIHTGGTPLYFDKFRDVFGTF